MRLIGDVTSLDRDARDSLGFGREWIWSSFEMWDEGFEDCGAYETFWCSVVFDCLIFCISSVKSGPLEQWVGNFKIMKKCEIFAHLLFGPC